MGWKAIKESYKIGHIVHIADGHICIGSPYIYNIITIGFDGKVSWGSKGGSFVSTNEDLARYFSELSADKAKLIELINAEDKFDNSLIVYTYDSESQEVVEKKCEAYDWPNCTHDGLLMYDNSFFKTRKQAIEYAKRNVSAGIEMYKENIERNEKE